ncbi:hypothetical protein O0L34_g4594 [Tuta absoluta]|nr:hypothetical protein O0L34_g4594 [Tuta absoluta]
MAISVAVAYWKAFFKKLRKKLLQSERACDLRLCSPPQLYDKHPGYYRLVRVRNILFVIVMLSLLMYYRGTEHQKAKTEDGIEAAYLRLFPEDSLLYVKFQEKTYPDLNVSGIKQLIHKYNTNETILNKSSFDCSVQWDKVILVVMVKELTQAFKFLLASLSQVREIESVFLIFSHSFYDENLNELIRGVNFCRVQQIFYPYSLQVNPKTFPGFEPNDCPYDMSITAALKKNCTGANTPDAQGYYRHPEKTETKHHWWWTANKVFEDLKFSKTDDAFVVFLESNLYLLEDFLHSVKYMSGAMRSITKSDFISLSSPTPENFQSLEKSEQSCHLEVQFYNPVHHSSVLGFDLMTWNQIVGNYDLFCDVDEYSWSKSIYHISKRIVSREKYRFKVLSSVLPRAYTLGNEVGILERVTRIEVFAKAFEVVKMQDKISDFLFPWEYAFYYEIDREKKREEVEDFKEDILGGGWSDPRDKKLCFNMTLRKIKKHFLVKPIFLAK